MSELCVPVHGAGPTDSSSTYSTLTGTTAVGSQQNMQQWRPRSAPKTGSSRSTSPFLGFLNRKGHNHNHNHHHHHHGHAHDDSAVSRKTKDVDADSNASDRLYTTDGRVFGIHAGQHDMALPARSSSGMSSSSKDTKESVGDGGPPPLTREEFEALPLAIQRKVRCL